VILPEYGTTKGLPREVLPEPLPDLHPVCNKVKEVLISHGIGYTSWIPVAGSTKGAYCNMICSVSGTCFNDTKANVVKLARKIQEDIKAACKDAPLPFLDSEPDIK
jgi:hypothetical protein